MMKKTLIALGALLAVSLAPAAYAGPNGGENGLNFTLDITATTPDNFGFADAHGSFTANANATDVTTSGVSSASAIGTGTNHGTASNATTAGGTATNGATAGGSSTSSASAGP